MENLPTTNNASESFNAKWNNDTSITPKLWPTLDHIIREDSLALTKWRENISTIRQVAESPEEGRTRRVQQKNKLERIKLMVQEYSNIHDKKEYLSVIVDLLD